MAVSHRSRYSSPSRNHFGQANSACRPDHGYRQGIPVLDGNQVAAENLIRRAVLAPFSATNKRTLITQEHPLLSMMPLASLQARVQEVFAPTRAHEVVEIQGSLAHPIGPVSMSEHKEHFCKKTSYLSKVNEGPPPAVQKSAITASVGGSGGTFKLAVESFTRLPLLEQTTVAYFKCSRSQSISSYEPHPVHACILP